MASLRAISFVSLKAKNKKLCTEAQALQHSVALGQMEGVTELISDAIEAKIKAKIVRAGNSRV